MSIYKTSSEEQLFELIRKNDQQAIAEILQRNKNKIFTSIYLLVKDRYIAEDLFQDTCIKVITKIREGKYSEDGKFCSWAMRIARNLSIDYLRVAKRMVKVTLPDGRDICELIGLSDANREDRLIQNQAHGRVRKMLDLIPYEQRETLVLRLYGNLSFKEIAELTGVSLNTSLGRMRYGLINLRKVMETKKIML
ncbi:MAG TPA: sigma-70 family RNA polymerase sigma factor [Chitinophagaceae bacterium]|nr:sigma-70 family RNA polymerase sigma factor [Chitinophagaceae bacterium]